MYLEISSFARFDEQPLARLYKSWYLTPYPELHVVRSDQNFCLWRDLLLLISFQGFTFKHYITFILNAASTKMRENTRFYVQPEQASEESLDGTYELVHPFFLQSKTRNRGARRVSYMILAVLGISLAGILAMQILFLNIDVTGYEESRPSFPLYKNTRFEECTRNNTLTPNCTSIIPAVHQGSGLLVVVERAVLSYSKEDSDGWCAFAVCTRDYKIIPSIPRNSAYRIPATGYFLEATMIAFAGVTMAKSLFFDEHFAHECKGLGILDWVANAWSMISFLIWWFYVGKLVSLPAYTSSPSFVAWVPTWRTAMTFHRHPISCRLRHHPTSRRLVMGLLYVLAVLQWVVGLWVLAQNYQANVSKYSCLEKQIEDAPGSTQCSPSELCLQDGFFNDVGFDRSTEGLFAMSLVFGCSSILAISAWLPLLNIARVELLIFWGKRSFVDRRQVGMDPFTPGRSFRRYLALLPDVCVLLFILAFLIALPRWFKEVWTAGQRNGRLVIDPTCHAIHIALSPWRDYYDVNHAQRALRIMRQWFNS
jgi:hypothetical protein